MNKLYALLIIFFFLAIPAGHAQDAPRPTFKITQASIAIECADYGTRFEKGYVTASEQKTVNIMIYFQKRDGTFVNRYFSREGSGHVNINASDCDFTGNYYAYACYDEDKGCRFPSLRDVADNHEKTIKTRTPSFRISKIRPTTKEDCKSPTPGVVLESGFVYSPSGGPVEIIISLEKKNGDWYDRTFTYYGTGLLVMDITDCELTGKYKITVDYLR